MPEIVIAQSPKRSMSRLDFLKRMTFAERVAIETASETDPEVRVVKQSLLAAENVRLDDPEMILGMDLYVSKGLISDERRGQILET
jgi:hypothetical protein